MSSRNQQLAPRPNPARRCRPQPPPGDPTSSTWGGAATPARVMTTMAERSVRAWRLGARARKATLVVHIVSAGSWIGIDVVMAVLVFTAVRTQDGAAHRGAAGGIQAMGSDPRAPGSPAR